jgi:hypothetical protein
MSDQPELLRLQVPVDWGSAADAPPQYANELIVQHTGQELVLQFFAVLPPFVIGPPETHAAQMQDVKTVRAHCVARLVIPGPKALQMIEVLSRYAEAVRDSQGATEGGEHATAVEPAGS